MLVLFLFLMMNRALILESVRFRRRNRGHRQCWHCIWTWRRTQRTNGATFRTTRFVADEFLFHPRNVNSSHGHCCEQRFFSRPPHCRSFGFAWTRDFLGGHHVRLKFVSIETVSEKTAIASSACVPWPAQGCGPSPRSSYFPFNFSGNYP